MIPDMAQVGKPADEPWAPIPEAPHVMLEGVTKVYGHVIGLNDVSLAVKGGVTGILGMNGAGKSTLFKLIVGRLKASQGTVRLFGTDPWKNPAPYARVRYVSESEQLYDWMTGLDFVTTLARLFGYTRDEAKERALHVLDFVGLADVANKQIGKYSKGMRQRVKLAQAVVHDPELLLLDEPTVGVDPELRARLWDHLRTIADGGTAVILTTHYIDEAAQADTVGLMRNGRLLAEDAPQALMEPHGHVSLEQTFLLLCRREGAKT